MSGSEIQQNTLIIFFYEKKEVFLIVYPGWPQKGQSGTSLRLSLHCSKRILYGWLLVPLASSLCAPWRFFKIQENVESLKPREALLDQKMLLDNGGWWDRYGWKDHIKFVWERRRICAGKENERKIREKITWSWVFLKTFRENLWNIEIQSLILLWVYFLLIKIYLEVLKCLKIFGGEKTTLAIKNSYSQKLIKIFCISFLKYLKSFKQKKKKIQNH